MPWQGANFWLLWIALVNPQSGELQILRLRLETNIDRPRERRVSQGWNLQLKWNQHVGAHGEKQYVELKLKMIWYDLFICSWLMTCFPYIYKDSKQKKGKPVLNEQGSSSINGAPTNWSWLQLVLACWTHSSECPIAGQYSFVYL